MSNLPTITEGEGGIKVVSAREFHASLGFRESNFSIWFATNFTNNRFFVENIDFSLIVNDERKTGKGGANHIDYAISIDAAKRIAMVQRNEFGETVRKHFVKVEALALSATEYHNNQLLLQANERVKNAQLEHAKTIAELGKFGYISIDGISQRIDIDMINAFLTQCAANNTLSYASGLEQILNANYNYLSDKSGLNHWHCDAIEKFIRLLSSAIRPDTPGKGVKVGY